MKYLLTLSALFYCLSVRAQTPHFAQPVPLMIGAHEINIEIADTPSLQQQGLSDRKSLSKDTGMLFIFPTAAPRSFWMYHCYFNIDIAFISSQGTITEIITMLYEPIDTPPKDLTHYNSRSTDIMYALEMNGGWFAAHHIYSGTNIELSQFKTVHHRAISP